MALLQVLLRKITKSISPLIVEGLYGDFWNFKKSLINNKSQTIIQKFKEHIYFRYLETKSCWIGLQSDIEDGIITPHGLYGIFISNKARIGRNAVIFHHVTIGSNNLIDSKRRGSPVIGNNVYIGAGAKLIGAINVGDNVRIGANCIVVNDVPENSVVVLKGTYVIRRESQLNNAYIENV